MKFYNYSIEYFNFFESGKKKKGNSSYLKWCLNDFLKNDDKRK